MKTLFLIFNSVILLIHCSGVQLKQEDPTLVFSIETKKYKNEKQFKFTNKILNSYVNQGKVNYKALKEDPDFSKSVKEISEFEINTLKTKEEKLAFWINAYNIFTLKLILENYPLKSINELHLFGSLYLGVILKQSIWDTYKFKIQNKEYNLNYIEHKILREKIKDFRIHSAIVCASKSCPPLRSEAYDPETINEQLDEQMQIFLSQKEKNYYDQQNKILYLSKIFDWFEEDFIKNNKSIVYILAPYFSKEEKEKILSSSPKITYTDYDWDLNE